AGAPLPNPPFSDGGFVPNNAGILRAEQGASTALSTLIRSSAKCIEKAVGADFKADSDIALDESNCRSKALNQYQRTLSRLSLPACLTAPVLQSLATGSMPDGVVTHLDNVAAQVYCDGPSSASTGVNTPSSHDALLAEVGIWKAFGKAFAAARKCADRAVKDLFQGDPNAVNDHQDCLMKVQSAYEGKAGRLVQQGTVPACHSPAQIAQLGLNTIYIE